MRHSFIEALRSSGPAREHVSKLQLFGQFVGRWEAEATAFLPDGTPRRHYWQIHFD